MLRTSRLPIFILVSAASSAGLATVGCAAAGPPPAAVPDSEQTAGQVARQVVPLTEDEKLLVERLRADVTKLGSLGERSARQSWQLSEAADFIASSLEELGLTVERSGYEVGEATAQNLSVTLQGGRRGDEILLLGAHYDCPAAPATDRNAKGVKCENAGATGTAALLALVRQLHGAKLERTIRVVFFATGESPDGDGEGRGARHVARQIARDAERGTTDPVTGEPLQRRAVIGMLHVDRLGALPRALTAQDEELLVDVVRTPGAEKLGSMLLEALEDEPVQVREANFAPTGPDSDVRAFYEVGVPVVAVSGPPGEPSEISLESMARVVMRLRHGVSSVVLESPTNDGMLTPLGADFR